MKSKIRQILNLLIVPINLVYFKIFSRLNKTKILKRNQVCDTLSGKKILILAPHIDDEIFGCGGSILKYQQAGFQVFIAYLTKSQKRGSQDLPLDIVKERKSEAVQVFGKIGLPLDQLFFLDGKDGDLINCDIKDQLLETIETVKPDTILLPIFLDTHPDHYATTIKLLDLYKFKQDLFKDVVFYIYESQSPITPLYSNTMLDVSDVFDEKLNLLSLFKSQKINLKAIKNSHSINALAFNKSFMEAYIKILADDYFELIQSSVYLKEENYLKLKKNLVANRDNLTLINCYQSSFKYKKNIFD